MTAKPDAADEMAAATADPADEATDTEVSTAAETSEAEPESVAAEDDSDITHRSRTERRKAAADDRARAQRDEATARAEAAEARLAERDQADAERMAGRLVDPSDLWRAGFTIEDLRDEEGVLDPALIHQAMAQIAAEHPHWAKQVAAPASMVTDGAGVPDTRGGTRSFADAFRPKGMRE